MSINQKEGNIISQLVESTPVAYKIYLYTTIILESFIQIFSRSDDYAVNSVFCVLPNQVRALKEYKKIEIETQTSDYKVIWFHVSSLGEGVSAIPLIQTCKDKFPDGPWKIIITCCSFNGMISLSKRIRIATNNDPDIIVWPVPWRDFPKFTDKFIKIIKPYCLFIIENDIWPNMIIKSIKYLDIKLISLINSRLSINSLYNWNRLSIFRNMINYILNGGGISGRVVIYAQSELDRSRYISLLSNGVNGGKSEDIMNIKYLGNLKFSIDPPPINKLININGRPSWLVSNLHPGEEMFIVDAHILLKSSIPSILTIIVPRYLSFVPKLLRYLDESHNLKYKLRSDNTNINDVDEIFIGDTVGDMGTYYNMSRIVFMGGSIIDNIGGHSPIEACHFNCVILHGKYIDKNISIYNQLNNNNNNNNDGIRVNDGHSTTTTTTTTVTIHSVDQLVNTLLSYYDSTNLQINKTWTDQYNKLKSSFYKSIKPSPLKLIHKSLIYHLFGIN